MFHCVVTVCIWICIWIAMGCVADASAAAAERPPNVVIIFTDDQGYGDVGCFGATQFATPNLDRMAAAGMRFTSFYAAQAVCTASRAALLTGCYPNRIGLLGALNQNSQHGIHHDETTLAELLKQRGYAAAIFGKWHLGHHAEFLPLRHGFDEYYGLPYSNDMSPLHPTAGHRFPALPLWDGERIVEHNPNQAYLTRNYTQRAVAFIRKNHQRPFFLYVAHSMPHVPLFVSEPFQGTSQQGLYGDVIQEIDWSVGQILDALGEHQIDESTLVVFTTDNGPWLSYGNHAGSAGRLREGKGTTFEGGVRVPCIMRWPGKVPAGAVCNELAATIDILPTVAALAGAPLPERSMDGKNIWPLMSGQPGKTSPHDSYYYYWGNELQAVRADHWKLHFPHTYRSLAGKRGADGQPAEYAQQSIALALYNLRDDIGEATDVSAQHPDVVRNLQAIAEEARQELGDSLTQRTGTGVRAPGKLTKD
jgi:arylsulfatase A-like enzyme